MRPLNEGDIAQELVDIPEDGILTVIPSDIINIDGTLYMQGMRVRGIGNVLQTHIWRSTDNGQNWDRIGTAKPGFNSGMTNLISWAEGPDGYIYQASTQFQRKDDVYLQRFKPEDIANYGKWEYFQRDTGQWTGKIGKPILSTDVRAGELNLRYIEGHWVLAMFNEQRMAIEVRISREIDTDWNAIKPADVVVSGPWNQTQDENNFSQLYGAYIVPGSTLGHMDLVVSQWKTSDDSRYNSTQFNVKGLDKFFGVTPQTNTMLRMAPQMDESARETRMSSRYRRLQTPSYNSSPQPPRVSQLRHSLKTSRLCLCVNTWPVNPRLRNLDSSSTPRRNKSSWDEQNLFTKRFLRFLGRVTRCAPCLKKTISSLLLNSRHHQRWNDHAVEYQRGCRPVAGALSQASGVHQCSSRNEPRYRSTG